MENPLLNPIFPVPFDKITAEHVEPAVRKLLAEASADEVMTIPGYDDPEKANKLIEDAKSLVEKYKSEGIAIPTSPHAAQASKNVGSAKQQADARLKEELSKLESQES